MSQYAVHLLVIVQTYIELVEKFLNAGLVASQELGSHAGCVCDKIRSTELLKAHAPPTSSWPANNSDPRTRPGPPFGCRPLFSLSTGAFHLNSCAHFTQEHTKSLALVTMLPILEILEILDMYLVRKMFLTVFHQSSFMACLTSINTQKCLANLVTRVGAILSSSQVSVRRVSSLFQQIFRDQAFAVVPSFLILPLGTT